MAKLYASRSPEVSERERRNGERSRRIAGQGMVLLENNGTLPLRETSGNIALYGNGARRTIKGGTGSGDVNSREIVNVEMGLEDAGYRVVSKEWIDRDCQNVAAALRQYQEKITANLRGNGQSAIMDIFTNPFIEPAIVSVEDDDIKTDLTDTAIYVLSRNSGEGADRRLDPGQYNLFEEEIEALKKLAVAYENLILVLNVGGVIDMKAIKSIPGIDAVLLMSQAGNYGGDALADVLTGKETPSGHLTTSWPVNYEDTPIADSFSYRNGDLDDEYYTEGIYVGYRYYDSFNVTPQYPFGYGKSYTKFRLEANDIELDGDSIRLQVRVINAGDRYAGRGLAQVYVSAPAGRLEKPYQELKGYAKSALLEPGGYQDLSIEIPTRSLASYDEEKAAWILESGDYLIRLGQHSRDSRVVARIHLDREVVTEQLSNRLPLDCRMQELSRTGVRPYSYPDEEAEIANALVLELMAEEIDSRRVTYSKLPKEIPLRAVQTRRLTLKQVREGQICLEDFLGQLRPEELAALCVGSQRGQFGASGPQIGASSTAVAGAAGDTTSLLIDDCGVRNLVTADGPAGLRLSKSFKADTKGNVLTSGMAIPGFEFLETLAPKPEIPVDAIDYYQYTTAIPIATLLAQTWDLHLIEEAGDIVGEEMEELGVDLWLAPGMNIHRSPLCGRNFEYYSEDPLITGKCAAADTLGVQKHKSAGTTIKHFAFNNQEDNRNHVNSHVSERAAREIYLRGFQIAVETAHPCSIMTSYNLINGEHTANSYDLLTAIARDEWGFDGIIMTDWGTTGSMGQLDPGGNSSERKYGDSYASGCVKAGNDLTMPGSQEDVDDILNALGKKEGEVPYPLTLAELQRAAGNMLKLILRMDRPM